MFLMEKQPLNTMMKFHVMGKKSIHVQVVALRDYTEMNVLVVNGSGSIGSALVSELFNEGLNVAYTSSNSSHSNHGESILWRYSGEESVRELFEDLKK